MACCLQAGGRQHSGNAWKYYLLDKSVLKY